ncbi:hypothetical protein GDO78_005442 [Eleutherodactylus coqui]|uniref:Uncharacterized protein n=1 Tax=Eleutherodactylus coqui TaxID=57060 RepID=A0A8J6KEQ3_ELECQ|nr:hypothetical protein GDO78_005442 [Eleutherodactylus coqui]
MHNWDMLHYYFFVKGVSSWPTASHIPETSQSVVGDDGTNICCVPLVQRPADDAALRFSQQTSYTHTALIGLSGSFFCIYLV